MFAKSSTKNTHSFAESAFTEWCLESVIHSFRSLTNLRFAAVNLAALVSQKIRKGQTLFGVPPGCFVAGARIGSDRRATQLVVDCITSRVASWLLALQLCCAVSLATTVICHCVGPQFCGRCAFEQQITAHRLLPHYIFFLGVISFS